MSLSSDLEWRPDRCQDTSEGQRDPRAGSAPLVEDVQVDPRKDSQSSSERFLEQSHSSMERAFEADYGRSCDYKVGSPKVPRHAGVPRGEHRGSRHRFL